MIKYRIRYEWPEGRVAYRKEDSLCKDPAEASVFTLAEASDIVKHRSRDARIVWGIITTKERADESKLLPLLFDPEAGSDGEAAEYRTRKKRSRRTSSADLVPKRRHRNRRIRKSASDRP